MPRLSQSAKTALVAERRTQILDAAAAVFAEKGFERATIRDVARAAGVSEGTIYIYFKNKQDLLIHLPRRFVQPRLESLVEADPATLPPPAEVFRIGAENMVQVILQNRDLISVLLSSLPQMDDEMRAEYMRDLPGYLMGFFENYLRAQQQAGVIRADLDPALTARIFPGTMLFFLLMQEVIQPSGVERFDYQQVIDHVVSIITRGVLAAPTALPTDLTPHA